MEELIFYHGGAEPSFTLEQLDVLRPSQKQQNQRGAYAGFYMYGEKDRDGAFHYSEQENVKTKTTTKGVEKITLDSNLKIYEMPPFSIVRITQDQIRTLQQQGYDLIAGKMMGKTEYVLLNKDKIKSMEFLPMNKRYDYHNFIPEYSNRVIEDYREQYDEQYDSIVNALRSLDEMFVYYDNVRNNPNADAMYKVQKTINSLIEQYNNYIPDLYLRKQEEINNFCKQYEVQFTQIKIAEDEEKNRMHQDAIQNGFDLDFILKEASIEKDNIDIQLEQEQQEKARLSRIKEAVKLQTMLDDLRNQYLSTFPEHERTLDNYRNMQREYVKAYYRKNSDGTYPDISSERLDQMYGSIEIIENMLNERRKQINTQVKVEVNDDISIEIPDFMKKQDNEEISRLQQQIQEMNNKINIMIQELQPYMVVPKVNEQITKLISKNIEIDSSKIVDSITDYQRVIDIKKTLVTYLENATGFIRTQQNKSTIQNQQVLSDDKQIDDKFWEEFEAKKEDTQEATKLSEQFWDDFMKKDERYTSFPSNKVLDSNGLFTMEYIAYTMEENKEAARQMLESNEKRKQMMSSMNEMTDENAAKKSR